MSSSTAVSASAESKGQGQGQGQGQRESIVLKIALVGDSGVGKTSLLVRYVERRWDSSYVETLGVNFMEKSISLDTSNTEVVMSIWDLGGDAAYASMLPLTCVDAVAVVFMFDLTQKQSLSSVREWYRQVRGLNKQALPFLVGTKFDLYYNLDKPTQEATAEQARKFAKAMKAPLIFVSSSLGISINKLFKLIFQRAFSIEPDVEQNHTVGEPLFEY